MRWEEGIKRSDESLIEDGTNAYRKIGRVLIGRWDGSTERSDESAE
jgi:hypothetical protein